MAALSPASPATRHVVEASPSIPSTVFLQFRNEKNVRMTLIVNIDLKLKVQDFILKLLSDIECRNTAIPESEAHKRITATPRTVLLKESGNSRTGWDVPGIFLESHLNSENALEVYELQDQAACLLIVRDPLTAIVTELLGIEFVDRFNPDIKRADLIVDRLARKKPILTTATEIRTLKASLDLALTSRIQPTLERTDPKLTGKERIDLTLFSRSVKLLSNSLQHYLERSAPLRDLLGSVQTTSNLPTALATLTIKHLCEDWEWIPEGTALTS